MEMANNIKKDFGIIKNQFEKDIYDGTENLTFKMRHPIYRALMKLEFEDVIRRYHKRISQK